MELTIFATALRRGQRVLSGCIDRRELNRLNQGIFGFRSMREHDAVETFRGGLEIGDRKRKHSRRRRELSAVWISIDEDGQRRI
jgi:hypothetical protein